MRRRDFLLGASTLASSTRALRAAGRELGSVAYRQSDGLWIRSLPDGSPRRVAAAGKSPRFSPSGQWIAFGHSVISIDGGQLATLPSDEWVWVPHRDALAVVTEEGLGLAEASNGWKPRLLIHGAGLPVFNSDGSQFVYSTAVKRGTGPGGEPMRDGQLRRAALDGAGARSRILWSKYLSCPVPYAWTQDSRYILFWEDPDFSASVMADGLELFRIPAAGGRSQQLHVSSLVHPDMLALSPGGSELAVSIESRGRETWAASRIAIVNIDSLAVRRLTASAKSAFSPAWSPDGKRLAYVQAPAPMDPSSVSDARPHLRQRRIWVADVSGATPDRQITSDRRHRDEEPMWSADGSQLLFCRLDSAGSGALWLMGTNGENPVQVSGALSLAGGAVGGFGFYGYIDWRSTFDWFKN